MIGGRAPLWTVSNHHTVSGHPYLAMSMNVPKSSPAFVHAFCKKPGFVSFDSDLSSFMGEMLRGSEGFAFSDGWLLSDSIFSNASVHGRLDRTREWMAKKGKEGA
jgi:hypothetical protein